MSKKLLSVLISIVLCICIMCSLAVTVGAATSLRGTVTGTMQDTSDASNGSISWSFTYDKTIGTASLTLNGDGYMPNYTEDSWFEIQNEVKCYITSVTIGEGIKSIMENAFMYEIKLESITLPESIEFIGDNAFAYTGIKSINIPSKVDYLSGKMFYNSPVEEIKVSQNNPHFVTLDGSVYSKDMKTLVVAAPGKFVKDSYYKFTIPQSVNIIAPNAFYMSQIREIVIPANVTEIRNMAFAGSSLECLRIDAGLKMIYDSAFLACSNLKEYVLPSTLTYIGWYSIGYGYELDVEGVEYILNTHGIPHGVININNCQSYLDQIGYSVEQFLIIAPIESVSIYSVITTVGEAYAKENGFLYTPTYVDYARPLSAKIVSGGIQIDWVPVSGATGYRILRKNAVNEWVVIGTASGENTSSFIDTSPLSNYVNEYSVKSYSINDTGYYDKIGVSCYFLKSPKIISATNSSSGITICWESVNGAYDYIVYRKAPVDTDWKPYATLSGGVTQFTDSEVEAGKQYSYTVSAKNTTSESLIDTNGISKIFLIQPRIAVYNIASGVAVRWAYSGTADSFKVYRKTAESDWSHIYTAKGTESVYVDTTVTPGTEYSYKVDVSVGNSESNSSDAGGAVIAMQSPMRFTVQNRVAGIQVKWSVCDGATGYYVYRRTVSSGWRRIAVIDGADKTSYIDTNTESGTTYIYTIKSFNGKYMSTYNTYGRRTIFLKSPKAYSVKSTKDGMQVTYTGSANAQGYYIYRRTPDSTWKLVGTVKNGNTTTFYDTTSTKGQIYTYTVRAYKNGVRSSYYSYGYKVKDVH